MSHRPKRRREFDPLASDPEDGDWDGRDTSPQLKPQKRRSKPSSSAQQRAKKKQRRGYRGSESDVVDDEDDLATDDSFSESASSEEEVEINPATGRSVRRAAKKAIKYEESSGDEIEDDPSDDEDVTPAPRRPTQRKSLVIKLKMRPEPRSTRARTGSKSLGRGRTPEVAATRRSSRISHDVEEPIVALTNSGKHAEIIRAGSRPPTHSPEPVVPRRPTRGGKGMKKPVSAIMEASQEASQDAAAEQQVSPGPLDEILPTEDTQVEASKEASSAEPEAQVQEEEEIEEMEGVIMESEQGEDVEDSDEGPVTRGARSLRPRPKPEAPASSSRAPSKRKRGVDESSDFEPTAEEEKEDEEMSEDDHPRGRRKSTSDESGLGRRSGRLRGKNSQRSRRNSDSDEHDSDLDPDELAEEAQALNPNKRRRLSRRLPDAQLAYDDAPKLRNRANKPPPDYRILRPEVMQQLEELEDAAPVSVPRNRGGRSTYRSLFPIQGPFGGGMESGALSGPGGVGAAGGVDSDSSDDEVQRMPRGVGGAVGMTPTTATAPHFGFPQTHGADAQQTNASGGGPANFGKVKDKKALADADPLGVDPNVNFDSVGGLDQHINQLKEMVLLPLLYPEVFQRFHITPPRGVLFHGPPGTGKTLLARALASSVTSQGQKVTFYMRKGADALSKWVGEAERQLRLLFEEARKTQPSIIFFDEIDGLAPVRSSKQEQIHASIVATLLALMDGMDGRGQVIVIGATNRPDSVDPALRRPGRFDREFYFPLPNAAGRRAILDIHTKNWDPPLKPTFKDELAEVTKGYGGADLRALCVEAALNAVQGTFPQIYSSEKKLLIDPSAIKVLAKDFMISVNKIVPSSERTASSGAAPLSKGIAPLLRMPLQEIEKILDEIIPRKKKLTALEEAQYDDRDDERGFEHETMMRTFESVRVFRPRLLITGLQGMGQQYLGSALLNKVEGLHVQSFDLPTILEDPGRTPEAAIIQLFKEVKRHKPSVIYIPNVNTWYQAVGSNVIKTFKDLLRGIHANEPVLLLGVMEQSSESEKLDPEMLRDLFGFSRKNQYVLTRPKEGARKEFFEELFNFIRMQPSDFPDPDNRKKRDIPDLEPAPQVIAEPDPREKAEQLKRQKKQDRLTLNKLKILIQPVMDQLKKQYRRFFKPIIPEDQLLYLLEEQDADVFTTDLPIEQQQEQGLYRPFEYANDSKGNKGIRNRQTGEFWYNLDLTIIEKRLSNGYYKRPQDFVWDIKTLSKDAHMSRDPERTIKTNEMLSNVVVDMDSMSALNAPLIAECEAVYRREQERARHMQEKAQEGAAASAKPTVIEVNVPQHPENSSINTTETSGPVMLGAQVPGQRTVPPVTPQRAYPAAGALSNGATSVADTNNHQQSNGSTVPSKPEDDTHMTDSQEPNTQMQTPSGPATQTQKSQVSGRTFVAPNSHPGEYHNSASTTTSGQKTSDRSSGGRFNTQSTNGATGQHPDFASMMPQEGGSQYPDTQRSSNLSFSTSREKRPPPIYTSTSSSVTNLSPILEAPNSSQPSNSQPSQSSSQHQFSVPAPVAPRQATNIMSILNSENEQPQMQAHPTFISDEKNISFFRDELIRRTSGLSVEQLEQVNASLMEALWRSRKEWNRNHVIEAVASTFNTVIEDIAYMQSICEPSQAKQDDRDRDYVPHQRYGIDDTQMGTQMPVEYPATQLPGEYNVASQRPLDQEWYARQRGGEGRGAGHSQYS